MKLMKKLKAIKVIPLILAVVLIIPVNTWAMTMEKVTDDPLCPVLNNVTISSTTDSSGDVTWNAVGGVDFAYAPIWAEYGMEYTNGTTIADYYTPYESMPSSPGTQDMSYSWSNGTGWSYPIIEPGSNVNVYIYTPSSDKSKLYESNRITIVIPGADASPQTYNSLVKRDSSNTTISELPEETSSTVSSSSSQDVPSDAVVAIEGGNITPGQDYWCQIAEFRPLVVSNTTNLVGNGGVDASVNVNNGGNDFGAYTFSGGNVENIGGIQFKNNGNGVYIPISGAYSSFAVDGSGNVAFRDGLQRPMGEYTIVYYDNNGRIAYRRFTIPSNANFGASIGNGVVSNNTVPFIPGAGTAENPLHFSIVKAFTPAGGTRQVYDDMSMILLFGFNRQGKPEVPASENAKPGVYEVEYTGTDGINHEIKITVK